MIATQPLCFFCRGPGTETSHLLWADDGRLGHRWIKDLDGSDPCQPLPKGYGTCERCGGGYPLDSLGILTRDDRYAILSGIDPAHLDADDELYCYACFRARSSKARHVAKARESDFDHTDADQARVRAVPQDGPGLTKAELMGLWSIGDSGARELAGRFVKAGDLVVEEVPGSRGSPQKLYRRPSCKVPIGTLPAPLAPLTGTLPAPPPPRKGADGKVPAVRPLGRRHLTGPAPWTREPE